MTNPKLQILNYKSQTISNNQITKNENRVYDLEQRSLKFAKNVLHLCQKMPKTITNNELVKQVTRSAASVGANYVEAGEALGKNDFKHRLRISRKEAKETSYWLELILEINSILSKDIEALSQESKELRNIFTSIINKFP